MIAAGPAIRVKRRRDSDPVEALLFRGGKRKRERADEIVYRLADKHQPYTQLEVSLDATEGERHIFHVKRHKNSAGDSQELKNPQGTAQCSSSDDSSALVDEEPNDEVEDYVYDYYYRDRATNSITLPQSVGYIEFEDPEDEKLLWDDADVSDDSYHFVDDEDSNAEDFYRNDYPDETDSEYLYDADGFRNENFSENEFDDEEDFDGGLGDYSDDGYIDYIQTQLDRSHISGEYEEE